MKDRITKDEMTQISTLTMLERISDECRSHSTCFLCPFRRYGLETIGEGESLYKSQIKNICSLYKVFNGRPDEMNLYRLRTLVEGGQDQ